jgi:hypothetical protein
MGYTRRRQTKQNNPEKLTTWGTQDKDKQNKQSREISNMGYTRRRKTKQKQSRETGNMGYTRQRQTKQNNPEKLVR